MKIKRIATLKTLKKYERALLEQVFPKYISKSGCDDRPQEILSTMRLECHNPFFMSCVLVDEADSPIGFFIAFVNNTRVGRRMYIDHAYAPNTGMTVKMYEMVKEKLDVEDVIWMTHRNPEAWVKLFKRHGHNLELYGHLIRTVPDAAQLGEEKED